MKKYLPYIATAVLLIGTACYTILVFIPNLNKIEIANTNITPVQEEIIEEENISNPIQKYIPFEKDQTYIYDFNLLNRDTLLAWRGKSIRLKMTYIGEYDENTEQKLEELLDTEYEWTKQLDENGNIVLGGPIFLKDNIYQLHIHNGISLGGKYFLMGDLLHNLSYYNTLVDTQIQIGDMKLTAVWSREINLKETNNISDADLVTSTCLEIGESDRRLVTGWKVME